MGPPSTSKWMRGVALLVLLGGMGLGPCTSEKELRAAEAKRDALLASTRPKSDFWPEVERKGTAVKAEKAATAELAKETAQNQALAQEIAGLEQRAGDARSQHAAADTALAGAKAELERARAERARRDETLAGFASRQRAGGPS